MKSLFAHTEDPTDPKDRQFTKQNGNDVPQVYGTWLLYQRQFNFDGLISLGQVSTVRFSKRFGRG